MRGTDLQPAETFSEYERSDNPIFLVIEIEGRHVDPMASFAAGRFVDTAKHRYQ
jgi:hypothetical protein